MRDILFQTKRHDGHTQVFLPNSMTKYAAYAVEDFVTDPIFQQWVQAPTPALERLWAEVIATHPHQQAAIQQARQWVQQLSSAETVPVSEATVTDIWQHLMQDVNHSSNTRTEGTSTRYWGWWGVALVLALGAMLTYWYMGKKPNIEPTEPVPQLPIALLDKGRTFRNDGPAPQFLTLPDGSTVRLAPNSQLHQPDAFGQQHRPLYLTGEATFAVTHDPTRPFVVYTHGLVAKVLGTSFRVKAYPQTEQVTVSVQTGKVSVWRASAYGEGPAAEKPAEANSLVLTPNQQVVLAHPTDPLQKSIVEAPMPIHQTNNRALAEIEFEDEPASKVLRALSVRYGIPIQFEEQQLAQYPLTMSVGTESLRESVRVLCQAIGATYMEKDGQIFIEHRK